MKKVLLSSTSYLPRGNSALRSKVHDISIGEYNNWANELQLDGYDFHALVCVLDDIGFDHLIEYSQQKHLIEPILCSLKRIKSSSGKPVILFLISNGDGSILKHVKTNQLQLSNRAEILRDINLSCPDLVYVVDVNACLNNASIYSDRNWYSAHCRLAVGCLTFIRSCIDDIVNGYFIARKKILVLDCDNTIWGGVIGEDGISGIRLGGDGVGAVFKDFQKYIVDLNKEGVLLALSSKNEEFDVFNVLENHDECLIKKDHLVSIKVNWNEKSSNIIEISRDLDLSLGGFVFWDDNPIEREKVKKILPEVLVVDPPEDISDWPRYLRNMMVFDALNHTSDDAVKNQQYKARAKFVEGAKSASDIFEYLRSIKITPSLVHLNESNSLRAVQLCQKTNQYNLRTKRHTFNELYEMSSSLANSVFMFKVTDIYGDHGNVGLVALRKIDVNILFIDTFLMSCRVLGRELDKWIVSQIVQFAKNNSFSKILGNFIPSERNSVSSQLYQDNGFVSIIFPEELKGNGVDEEGIFYQLDVDSFVGVNLEIFNG